MAVTVTYPSLSTDRVPTSSMPQSPPGCSCETPTSSSSPPQTKKKHVQFHPIIHIQEIPTIARFTGYRLWWTKSDLYDFKRRDRMLLSSLVVHRDNNDDDHHTTKTATSTTCHRNMEALDSPHLHSIRGLEHKTFAGMMRRRMYRIQAMLGVLEEQEFQQQQQQSNIASILWGQPPEQETMARIYHEMAKEPVQEARVKALKDQAFVRLYNKEPPQPHRNHHSSSSSSSSRKNNKRHTNHSDRCRNESTSMLREFKMEAIRVI